MIRLRRLVGWWLREITPGMTACHHCGWPWKYVKAASVEYAPGRSIFVCCARCWPRLTPKQQLHYTSEVVYGSGRGWRWNEAWDPISGAEALMAVALHGAYEELAS